MLLRTIGDLVRVSNTKAHRYASLEDDERQNERCRGYRERTKRKFPHCELRAKRDNRVLRSLFLAVIFLVLATPSLAFAKGIPSCKSPRNAIDSVFVWQLGKPQSLTHAARCFERGGRTQPELEEIARRLKVVFDAEGAFIDTDKVSDDPDYLDDDKNSRFTPHGTLARVAVEKREGRWVWTRESLDWIDRRYDDRLGWFDKTLERMPGPLRFTLGDVAMWQYASLAALLLLGIGVSKLLHAVLVARARRQSEDAHSWRHRVVDVIAAPGATLVTAFCLRLLYPELRLPVEVSSVLHLLVRLLVTFGLGWAAYRGADVLTAVLEERAERTESRLDDHLVPVIQKAVKGGVLLSGVIALLHHLTIDVTALFATLGIGTLAIGLAAKDTLANLFGSISIFVDKPFKIGDWIKVEGIDGIVEEVGFRSTRVRTFYDSLVVIPNAKLADAKIDNYGQRQYRRCQFTLHLVHASTPERIDELCAGIRAIVAANENTRRENCEVHLSNVAVASLEVLVTFFFLGDPEVHEPSEKHRILMAILSLTGELGLALASPPIPAATEAQPMTIAP
jgi:MscS family membrane protein